MASTEDPYLILPGSAAHSDFRLQRLARATERFVWRAADRVLPVTAVMGDHVAAAGVARDRIEVVPNGIDLEEFPAPPAPAGARPELVLGFVGAGGIGFELLTAMNLFQYRTVSMLLVVTFAIVIAAERLSAALRRRIG